MRDYRQHRELEETFLSDCLDRKNTNLKMRRQLPSSITEPWRNFINWDESVQHLLQNLVASFAPGRCGDTQESLYNILLVGDAGSGKSSFVNSIENAFRRRIANKALVHNGPTVATREFRMYELRESPSSPSLPWRIGDTMGLTRYTGDEEVEHILQIVDGHVPQRYKFTEGHGVCQASNPDKADKVDCVVIVLDCCRALQHQRWTKLGSLRRRLMQRNIPTYVLLTHTDLACREVKEDVKTVYRSNVIRDMVLKISKLHDLPLSQMFPVVNYSDQVELNKDMDILLLNTFRQIIRAKERECRNMKYEIASLVPRTKTCLKVPFFNIVLLGQISSGKSTFFNAINSILTNRIMPKAEAGEGANSLTREFRMYKITPPQKKKPLSLRICDTPGLQRSTDNDIDVRNVLSAIDGHVPDKHKFTGDEFHQDSQGYISSPTLSGRAHCVCIVIDAGKMRYMLDNVWRKLRSIKIALKNREIPTLVLLTKIDLVLDNQNFENIHRNVTVRKLKQFIQTKLELDVKEDDILPMKNYVTEVEFDVDMDVLLLDSLHNMLKCAQNYLDKK